MMAGVECHFSACALDLGLSILKNQYVNIVVDI